jgi:hypothetical protein
MVHTTLGWFRPKFLVRTRKKWYSPATRFVTTLLVQTTCSWFKPEIQVQTSQSGVKHEAGSYHLFLVCTSKVVQTTKQWYEPSVVQTTLGWSGPLFLVQTTKTWSIPSFFRLLSSILRSRVRDLISASHTVRRFHPSLCAPGPSHGDVALLSESAESALLL